MNRKSNTEKEDYSPDVNMARYLKKIKSYPILSPEEEYRLAVQYKKEKKPEDAHKLINAHLRLVVKVVAKYRGYGISVSELISEGNLGLMYALDKFEPEQGFRFSTYALWWIKAAIQKYILNSWSLVKIGTTTAQKKLFFNLRKIKNKLNLNDDKYLSDDILNDIAKSLDVSVKDVTDMNYRLKSHDGSLNIKIGSSSDNVSEWIDFIVDKKPNQEEVLAYGEIMKYRRNLFDKALNLLNQREKDILFKRKMREKAITLEDLSQAYGISKERVRQIEVNSIKKIRNVVSVVS